MGTFSIWHWIIVLVIVVLVFGTRKLRNLGNDLGSALKGFKEGMKESETENTLPRSASTDESVIEVTASKEASAADIKNSAPQSTGATSPVTDAGTKEKTQART